MNGSIILFSSAIYLDEMLIDELANLLNETAEAHHKAFAATEGEDPDYLPEKMRKMLKAKFTKSELIYLLVMAENGVERRDSLAK